MSAVTAPVTEQLRCVTVSMNPPPCLADFRMLCELAYFRQLLEIHNGSIVLVARAAGMRRVPCYDKLRRLRLIGMNLTGKDLARIKSWDHPELARFAAKVATRDTRGGRRGARSEGLKRNSPQ